MGTIEELETRVAKLEKANEELLFALKSALGYGIDLTDVEDVIGPQIDVQSFSVPTTTDPEEQVRQEQEFAQWQYEQSLETFMRLGYSEDEARALIERKNYT